MECQSITHLIEIYIMKMRGRRVKRERGVASPDWGGSGRNSVTEL